MILKWIDRLEITDKLTSSYEYKLLFRGTRDGFTQNKFHEICDGISRTITIIKVEGSNEILGGFNPIEWMSDESRVMYENYAINNGSIRGPSFGNGDLTIWKVRNLRRFIIMILVGVKKALTKN
ncbi:hypothetical protein RhiirA1_466654 [Rhizophagus irregularis]|uniref:TLDc domain-containing protein n=1 Tax=Rhizophagus irregularis TaxID=588596 RepID=A0A2N0RDL4_9GLOM|nr:hypothetical protein RhiirA1_466654 [Rhizophagus irregularis]